MHFVCKRARLALGLLAPIALVLAADLPPDVLLVAHTVQANRQLFTHLPQFTCLETISRSKPRKPNQKVQLQDIVQLDVAVGDKEELYSWPGDPAFSSSDLPSLVGHGFLANGLFENFAHILFISNSAVIRAAGPDVVLGRKAFHFTFRIPSLQGFWNVNWLGAQGRVEQQGEFWVDEKDLALLRLDAAAVDIPVTLPLSSLNERITYRSLAAGAARVLIPETVTLKAVERSGLVNEDSVSFSHCRVFEAESSLLVDSAPTAEAGKQLASSVQRFETQNEVLPGGLLLSIRLDKDLPTVGGVVGARISAVLESDVKIHSPSTPLELIPKGALVTGRVRELQRMDDMAGQASLVGLEFDELHWPGHLARFFANLYSMQPTAGVDTKLSGETTTDHLFGRTSTTVTSATVTAIPGVASFFLTSAAKTLPKGFRMTWRTQEIKRK